MGCRVLGPIEVHRGDGALRLRGQQAMLLAQLVAAYPEPASFGLLEIAFWGDNPPSKADNAMRVAVTRLRNKMDSDSIEFSSAGYRLTVSAETIDAVGFERHVNEANEHFEAGRTYDAFEEVRTALSMWRGDPFATVADGISLEPAIRKLTELHAHAEDLEVELLLANGRFGQAAVRSSETTNAAPLRERRWEFLMLALYQSGRATEALRVFQQYRSFLAEEVGLEPGPTICELERSIAEGKQFGDPQVSGVDDPITGLASSASRALHPQAPVPTVASSFVQREVLATAISDALELGRLVTMVGPPGVGKTRLAREYALAFDTDQVWWIDLAAESPAGAVAAFSERFGVASSDDPAEVSRGIIGRLGQRDAVLVLDNCEQVISQVVPLLDALLAGHPSLRVLATSRQPLLSKRERVVRVGEMSGDEAVRLLRQRIDPARPISADLAARVVASVDHLPLAIEILATRLRTHTPAELLRDRSAPGDGLLRYGATFEPMLQVDRRLFASLGVMAASFDIAAAAHVFDAAEKPTRAGLDRLVEASVIEMSTAGATPRYRLLQPMRDLAWSQLEDAGDLSALRQRHAEFFAAVCVDRRSGLMDGREERAVDALEADGPQIRAAWQWSHESTDVDRAAMLAFSWWTSTLRSLRHRDYSWPSEALSMEGFDQSAWDLEVLAAASMAEWARGRMGSSIRAGEQAVEQALERGVPVPLDARFGLISSYGFRTRYDEAHSQLISLITEARQQGDMYRLSGGQAQVGFAFALLGMTTEALKQARAALDSAEASNNTSALAFAHHAAALATLEDDAQQALAHTYESIRLSTRSRNTWLTGWTTATLAGLYRRLGRHEESAQKLGELITHWRSAEMEPQLVHTVCEAALLFDAVGDGRGVGAALTVGNEGRTRHPLMPTDEARLSELYRSVSTPAPTENETHQLNDLQRRLETING